MVGRSDEATSGFRLPPLDRELDTLLREFGLDGHVARALRAGEIVDLPTLRFCTTLDLLEVGSSSSNDRSVAGNA